MSQSHNNTPDVSLEQFREVFEEIEDIILIIRKSGKVEYVNRALRKTLGFVKKRFTGKDIAKCGLFEKGLSQAEILRKIFRGSSFVTIAQNADGEMKNLSWKTKIFMHKKEKMVMATIRDITAQVKLQKKVEKYTENLQEIVFQRTHQLEREKQKALELHQAKVVFLSRMSHEMRTPLTAIRGYAEMLQEPDISVEQRQKQMKIIGRNAGRLLEMINETLDMVKLEQDKYQIQEKSFNLASCVQEVIDTFLALAEEKGLTLDFTIKEGIPEVLYSDPSAIRQILTNLIGNSIKFTKEGKIRIRIKQRIFEGKMTRKLYFYVEDTGIGIPEESHGRVFKSFEQYLDNQDTHHRGSGLGLAISLQLARLLGGNLKLIFSKPGEGSTFVFSLPMRKPPSERTDQGVH